MDEPAEFQGNATIEATASGSLAILFESFSYLDLSVESTLAPYSEFSSNSIFGLESEGSLATLFESSSYFALSVGGSLATLFESSSYIDLSVESTLAPYSEFHSNASSDVYAEGTLAPYAEFSSNVPLYLSSEGALSVLFESYTYFDLSAEGSLATLFESFAQLTMNAEATLAPYMVFSGDAVLELVSEGSLACQFEATASVSVGASGKIDIESFASASTIDPLVDVVCPTPDTYPAEFTIKDFYKPFYGDGAAFAISAEATLAPYAEFHGDATASLTTDEPYLLTHLPATAELTATGTAGCWLTFYLEESCYAPPVGDQVDFPYQLIHAHYDWQSPYAEYNAVTFEEFHFCDALNIDVIWDLPSHVIFYGIDAGISLQAEGELEVTNGLGFATLELTAEGDLNTYFEFYGDATLSLNAAATFALFNVFDNENATLELTATADVQSSSPILTDEAIIELTAAPTLAPYSEFRSGSSLSLTASGDVQNCLKVIPIGAGLDLTASPTLAPYSEFRPEATLELTGVGDIKKGLEIIPDDAFITLAATGQTATYSATEGVTASLSLSAEGDVQNTLDVITEAATLSLTSVAALAKYSEFHGDAILSLIAEADVQNCLKVFTNTGTLHLSTAGTFAPYAEQRAGATLSLSAEADVKNTLPVVTEPALINLVAEGFLPAFAEFAGDAMFSFVATGDVQNCIKVLTNPHYFGLTAEGFLVGYSEFRSGATLQLYSTGDVQNCLKVHTVTASLSLEASGTTAKYAELRPEATLDLTGYGSIRLPSIYEADADLSLSASGAIYTEYVAGVTASIELAVDSVLGTKSEYGGDASVQLTGIGSIFAPEAQLIGPYGYEQAMQSSAGIYLEDDLLQAISDYGGTEHFSSSPVYFVLRDQTIKKVGSPVAATIIGQEFDNYADIQASIEGVRIEPNPLIVQVELVTQTDIGITEDEENIADGRAVPRDITVTHEYQTISYFAISEYFEVGINSVFQEQFIFPEWYVGLYNPEHKVVRHLEIAPDKYNTNTYFTEYGLPTFISYQTVAMFSEPVKTEYFAHNVFNLNKVVKNIDPLDAEIINGFLIYNWDQYTAIKSSVLPYTAYSGLYDGGYTVRNANRHIYMSGFSGFDEDGWRDTVTRSGQVINVLYNSSLQEVAQDFMADNYERTLDIEFVDTDRVEDIRYVCTTAKRYNIDLFTATEFDPTAIFNSDQYIALRPSSAQTDFNEMMMGYVQSTGPFFSTLFFGSDSFIADNHSRYLRIDEEVEAQATIYDHLVYEHVNRINFHANSYTHTEVAQELGVRNEDRPYTIPYTQSFFSEVPFLIFNDTQIIDLPIYEALGALELTSADLADRKIKQFKDINATYYSFTVRNELNVVPDIDVDILETDQLYLDDYNEPSVRSMGIEFLEGEDFLELGTMIAYNNVISLHSSMPQTDQHRTPLHITHFHRKLLISPVDCRQDEGNEDALVDIETLLTFYGPIGISPQVFTPCADVPMHNVEFMCSDEADARFDTKSVYVTLEHRIIGAIGESYYDRDPYNQRHTVDQTNLKIRFDQGLSSLAMGWFGIMPRAQWFLLGDTVSFNNPDRNNEGHTVINTSENIVPGSARTRTIPGISAYENYSIVAENWNRPINMDKDSDQETKYNVDFTVGHSPRYYDFSLTDNDECSESTWVSLSPRYYDLGTDNDATEDFWDYYGNRMIVFGNPNHITPKDEDMLKISKPMMATILPGQDTGLCR